MSKLSEYELVRERNLKERMKILEDLEVYQAASDLTSSLKKTPKQKPLRTPNRNVSAEKRSRGSVRRSLRLMEKESNIVDQSPSDAKESPAKTRKMQFSYQGLDYTGSDGENSVVEQDYVFTRPNEFKIDHTDMNISHDTAISGTYEAGIQRTIDDIKQNLNDGKSSAFRDWSNSDESLEKDMSSLKLLGRVKVGNASHSRVTTYCFHPSTSKILLFTGSTSGHLWMGDLSIVRRNNNVEIRKFYEIKLTGEKKISIKTKELQVQSLKLKTDINNRKCASLCFTAQRTRSMISCVGINSENPSALFSCAYDGSLQKFDFERFVFQSIYQWGDDGNDVCKHFDFISADSMILVRYKAPFAIIDCRASPNELIERGPKDRRFTCVNVHPNNKNWFVTSASDGMVDLWDTRKTSSPLCSMEHSRSVRSALFSPLTGQHILTTSLEDTINVWTSDTARTDDFRKTLKLNHNNKTGRWLTPFSAIWHPKSENYFMCGSLDPYRHVDIFSCEGRFGQNLPVLTAVCSLNGFHPSYNMAIGLNSSTYLYIWLPSDA